MSNFKSPFQDEKKNKCTYKVYIRQKNRGRFSKELSNPEATMNIVNKETMLFCQVSQRKIYSSEK